MCDGQQAQLETVHGCALLQNRNGFFAEGAVVINQGNVFALEFVSTTHFFDNVLNDHIASNPVGTGQGEVPLEDIAIS